MACLVEYVAAWGKQNPRLNASTSAWGPIRRFTECEGLRYENSKVVSDVTFSSLERSRYSPSHL